jgi:prevent-host-death family protein
MNQVNILDAKNNLSQLVSAASRGEDVVIAKRGTPVVRLVALHPQGHTAAEAARWLTSEHPPAAALRTPEQLDEQIAQEREGWE